MYILKGFASFSDLYNNVHGQTAPFGELTTQSMTFTRDLRTYGNPATYPNTELYVFRCVDDSEIRVTPTAVFINKIHALNQWVYDQYKAKLIPPQEQKATFISSLENQFPEFQGIDCGEIKNGTPAGARCPEFIQFRLLDGAHQYQLTIWYSNEAFNTQYEDYEIFVVPPLPDIANLVNNKVYVYNQLLNRDQNYIINAIQDIKGDNPETALVGLELMWHDPNDANSTLMTTWTAVIYGSAGIDNEAIKDAIRDYIDTHSNYPNWPNIYPGLYSEAEFSIIPFWANYALNDNSIEVGLYSSQVQYGQASTLVNTFLPSGYGNGPTLVDHLNENMAICQSVYRTLMFAVLGNPNNRESKFKLRDIYPDYMAIPTTDPDSLRMSVLTQEFVIKLVESLDLAYSYKPTDILPSGYTRILRRGFYYVVFEHQGYSFPILTRFSYKKLLGS